MVYVVITEFNYNGFLGYTGLIMDKLGGFFVTTNYEFLGVWRKELRRSNLRVAF
jgi:hypothetical protein